MVQTEMTNKNINNVFKQILKDDPKNIGAIEKLALMKGFYNSTLSFVDILSSEIWNKDEKIKLCKIFHYDQKVNEKIEWDRRDVTYAFWCEGTFPLEHCIISKSLSGAEAVLDMGGLPTYSTIPSIPAYIEDQKLRCDLARVILEKFKDNKETDVFFHCNGNSKTSYKMKNIIQRYIDKRWDLVNSEQPVTDDWIELSPLNTIIKSKDKELIKVCLKYCDDINPSLNAAVLTGNTEIVDILLDLGAEIDYSDKKIGLNNVCALKTAIDNNDLNMVKHLHKRGANLNLVHNQNEIDIITKLTNPDKNKDHYSHDPSREKDKEHRRFKWLSSPLNYGVKIDKASNAHNYVGNYKIEFYNGVTYYNSSSKTVLDLKKRQEVIDYLIDNGAKNEDGQLNYTDLIKLSIFSGSIVSFKKYISMAVKNEKLNTIEIDKIIDFAFSIDAFENQEIFNEVINFAHIVKNGMINDINSQIISKLMPKIIYRSFEHFQKYNQLITELTSKLSKDEIKKIPACSSITNIEEIKFLMSLGYDINAKNEDGNNTLMNMISKGKNSKDRTPNVSERFVDDIKFLVDNGINLGDINNNGDNSLSLAISRIIEYGHSECYDLNRYSNVDFYDRRYKEALIYMIQKANKKDVMQDIVVKRTEKTLQPIYGQSLHQDLILELKKKGFKFTDEYFESVLQEGLSNEYIREQGIDCEQILNFMLDNFNNSNVGLGNDSHSNKIKLIYYMQKGYSNSKKSYDVIRKILKRYYITTKEQLDFEKNPHLKKLNSDSSSEKPDVYYDIQNSLGEIFVMANDLFSPKQACQLIDSCPIYDLDFEIDNNSWNGPIMQAAIKNNNIVLAKMLAQRGAKIDYINHNGEDRTWGYVETSEMKEFVEKSGQKSYGDLHGGEVDLYHELINESLINIKGRETKKNIDNSTKKPNIELRFI